MKSSWDTESLSCDFSEPGLQIEFQDSQDYTEKPYFEKTNKQQRILNRGISNGREALKEMFKVLSHQRNANQNSSEIPSYTHQNG